MKSLKVKMVLALVLTSLLVALLVAVITPIMVEHEFLENIKKAHYVRFTEAIERYQQRHHSWGTAEDALRFAHQEEQNRQAARSPGHRPLPPGATPGNRVDGFKPPPPGYVQGEVPFEFALFDHQGNVLHKGKGFQIGQQVGQDILDESDPLYRMGEIVAYALPEGELPLTEADKSYLHTLEETLLFTIMVAIVLIIPLGIWEGNRLVSTLNHLIQAVNHMAAGDLEQKVPTKSRDEIGGLALAFNTMNDKLVEAYRDLEQSRDMIAHQADKLRELSIRDELTGLYNRRFFNEEVKVLLANAMRYGHAFSVVLGDIDHFKQINDGYSHAIGDEVLKKIAEILRNSIRDSDIVARYGGEEMVLALPTTSPAAARDMMERIRKAIEDFPWGGVAEGLQVTMSFGICDRIEGKDFEHLLALADEQLYKAKNAGRNRICSLSLS